MKNSEISAKAIASFCGRRGASVYAYGNIPSTNDEARRLADEGVSLPLLVIADAQSAGRGRMGRSFFSPSGRGIYMSVLLEAKEDPYDNVRLTTAAAVAVSQSIEELLGISTQIKWINDVYLQGKKVCGILCESFRGKDGGRFVTVGVGINLFEGEFPDELSGIATSLCAKDISREELAARIFERICLFFEDLSRSEIIDYYRAHSCVIGKRIRFVENGISQSALALEVDSLGRLVCELDGGERRVLASGEISLRTEDMI